MSDYWDGVLARQKKERDASFQRSLARFQKSYQISKIRLEHRTPAIPLEVMERLKAASARMSFKPILTGNPLLEVYRQCSNFAGCRECVEMHRLERETGIRAEFLRDFLEVCKRSGLEATP